MHQHHNPFSLPSKRTAILPVVQLQHDNMTKRKLHTHTQSSVQVLSLNATNQHKKGGANRNVAPYLSSQLPVRAHVKRSLFEKLLQLR